MDSIIRALAIYLFLLVMLKVAGKRTMADMTPFDMILLLIISEATQQAMVGQNYSLTTAFLVISTLIGVDILLSALKQKSPTAEKLLDSVPVLIFAEGQLVKENAQKERIDREDILEAARNSHGLENLTQIKYAVLERDGSISVVPKS